MNPTIKNPKPPLRIAPAVAFILLCALLLPESNSAKANEDPVLLLKQIATIDVPGPKGKRFDYLTIDPSRHLLFSTHLGAGLLYAIDLRTNKVIKTFEDLPGIEGVEIAPDVNKAYTSNWQENKIGV